MTARTESSASNFYSRGVNTGLLSENVINLIEAQLREGARSMDGTTQVAWASQPGMIRTYDSNGLPHKFYKLYSSDSMNGVLTLPFNGNADAPVAGWGALPNVYTDLNEPITTVGGGVEYPIIDPNILGSVEGFSFNAQTENGISNTLPMPVKWLYVLKNGSLTTATTTTGAQVSIPGATTANPIVGRVAFWTDDETSKVNINTASEGTFWDVPISSNNEEYGNPTTQSPPYGFNGALPAGSEYQRLPGHPATTCLSPIFGYGATPILPNTSLATWPLTPATYTSTFAPYYSLTPMYASGGSMGGAQPPFTSPNYATSNYRLFDSVDELAYDPGRIGVGGANAALYLNASPAGRLALGITPQVINQRRFFLTAHSRAPEETLFGTPRVSLWPLQAQTQARTAKDNLLAFCSTIGGNPYYFQRATYFQLIPSSGGATTTTYDAYSNPSSSSQSTTMDFSGIEGIVGSPTAPGATAPQTGVARNQDIYGYLQALTGQNIPGFGGNFLTKYPGANGTTDRDQILTEMFDLIRCGVNTINLTPTVYPNYSFTLYPANYGNYAYPGAGSAMPIAISTDGTSKANTHGLGRTYNIAEVTLGFMASDIDLNDGQAHSSPSVIPVTAAGQPDPTCLDGSGNWKDYVPPQVSGTGVVPAVPRRISVGTGLPWACEVDYPTMPATGQTPVTRPLFAYWDTASASPGTTSGTAQPEGNYGTYYWDPTTKKLFVNDGKATPTPLPSTAVTIADPQTAAVAAYLIVRPYSLLTGFPISMPKLRIRVSGLDNLTLNSKQLSFPSATDAVEVINTENNTSEYTGGGVVEAFFKAGVAPGGNQGTVGSGNANNYPLISQYGNTSPGSPGIPLGLPAYPSPYGGEDPEPTYTDNAKIRPANPVQIHNITTSPTSAPVFAATSMAINGTTLKIEIFDDMAPTVGQAQLLQTVYVNIPQMTLPVPSIEMAGSLSSPESEATEDGDGNGAGGPRIPGFSTGMPPPQYGVPSATSYSGATALGTGGTSYPALAYYYQLDYNPMVMANRFLFPGFYGSGSQRIINRGDTIRSFVVNPSSKSCGDMRLIAANPFQSISTASGSVNDLFVALGQSLNTWSGNPLSPYSYLQQPWSNLFIRQIHSLSTDSGDGVGLMPLVYSWVPNPPVAGGTPTPYTGIGMLSPKNRNSSYGGTNEVGIGETNGALFAYPAGTTFTYPDGISSGNLEHFACFSAPAVTPELQGAFMDGASSKKIQGDWTDGLGPSGDGPFIAKPDEGVQEDGGGTYSSNYFQTNQNFDKSLSSYSPNRQVQSAVMFGGLPSIVNGGLYPWAPSTINSGGVPWCTLLFCPNPASNDGAQMGQTFTPHPGFGVGSGVQGPTDFAPYSIPPDYLFLDLFWMPVVDPYAISEPFSTAGKINLNYEIVPFGNYIHRSTALHAVMKSTKILAIPTQANDGCLPPPRPPQTELNFWPSAKAIYINVDNPVFSSGAPDFSYRYNINLAATIDDFPTTGNNYSADSQFYTRFITQGDLFRSASEICNIFLVPKAVPFSASGPTYFYNTGNSYLSPSAPLPTLPLDALPADMETWWSHFRLTGDNGREMPYKYLYPRLTTKSNTFQVHMRVQILAQSPADRASGTFNSGAGDSIVSEYRGSAIVERYIDPNQTSPTTLPDFATTFPGNPTGATSTVDNYVRYRVISTHAFSP